MYDIEDVNLDHRGFAAIIETQGIISRLDERAKRSPLTAGWQERLLFDEALACQLAEGNLVHMDDLVLLDGDSRRGSSTPDLLDTLVMLRTWRAAMHGDASDLLRAARPGISSVPVVDRSDALPTPIRLKGIRAEAPIAEQPQADEGALEHWRRMVRQTATLPPLLAAAIAWDVWLTLIPEPGSAWRAPLLGSLVLRHRGLTSNMLLPIDTGRRLERYRRDPRQPLAERLLGFISWMQAAATRADKAFDALVLAEKLLRSKIAARRRPSRLSALVDLFLSRPLVSIPFAARHLRCSPQAVAKMLPLLGSTPVQITEGRRFRAWRVA